MSPLSDLFELKGEHNYFQATLPDIGRQAELDIGSVSAYNPIVFA